MAKIDFRMSNGKQWVPDAVPNRADIDSKVLQLRGESLFAMLANNAPKVENCACAKIAPKEDKLENEVPALSEAMPIPAPSEPLQATIPNGCGCNKVANSGTSEGVKKGWETKHGHGAGVTKPFKQGAESKANFAVKFKAEQEAKRQDLIKRYSEKYKAEPDPEYAEIMYGDSLRRYGVDTKGMRSDKIGNSGTSEGVKKAWEKRHQWKDEEGETHETAFGHNDHAEEGAAYRKASKELSEVQRKIGSYHAQLPLDKYKEVLDKHGFSSKGLDGIYTGADGRASTRIGPRTFLHHQWHKMDSGKYETNAYLAHGKDLKIGGEWDGSAVNSQAFSRDMFSNAKPKEKDKAKAKSKDKEPDGDTDDNPYHETITKHGYALSHKTDTSAVYKHGELPDRFVSVSPGDTGHKWTFGKVGSPVQTTGAGAAHLDNALGAHVGAAMEKAAEAECKCKKAKGKDKKLKNAFSADMFKVNNSGTSEGAVKGAETKESLKGAISKHLETKGGTHKLGQIRKQFGHTKVDSKNPLGNPVHVAMKELRDSGHVNVHGGEWGEPSFSHAKPYISNSSRVPATEPADSGSVELGAQKDPYQIVAEKLSNSVELDPADVLAMNTVIEKDFGTK